MSIPYGSGGYQQPMQPLRRVNFGWINEAFELFKANAGVWVIATLLAFVPSVVGFFVGLVEGIATGGQSSQPQPGSNPFSSAALSGGLPPGLSIAIQIFSSLYSAWLMGGVYRTAVKQVRGEMISIGDLFSGGALMWKMLGYNIVYGLAAGLGTLFCILPGLLISGLLFPGYALIADGETVGNAMTRSWDGMKQDLWNSAAFVFVMGLVVFAGVLACGVGLFVTLPMFYLVAALAYRDMIGMPGLNQAAPAYGTAAPGVWPPAPNAAPPPQQYPGFPPQQYPPPVPPQQYPGFPPQQYAPPPPQQYPSVPPAAYPPEAQEKPAEEPPTNPWQSRPPTSGSGE